MKAIYAGSFNPLHAGHIDILKRAIKLFGDVTLVLAVNPGKIYISAERRKETYEWLFKEIGLNVKIEILSAYKLLADYCAETGVTHIVKGLRNGTDLDSEMTQEWYTKGLNPNVETVYFTTDNTHRFLSSSSIKAFAKMDKEGFINYMMKVNRIEGANDTVVKTYLDWVWRNEQ